MYDTYPHPNPPRPSWHGYPYRGVNTSYGYPNPLQYSYFSSPKVETSTSYCAPHMHLRTHGPYSNSFSYGGTTMNPCYPSPIPPPVLMVPRLMVPQALSGHPTPPPQGSVFPTKCAHYPQSK
jgi:hypothetical protein